MGLDLILYTAYLTVQSKKLKNNNIGPDALEHKQKRKTDL